MDGSRGIKVRRIAFFVEGYTELRLIEKLVLEIAGKNRVQIKGQQMHGSGSSRKVTTVIAEKPEAGQEFYVLIVDCGGETAVRTRIHDDHKYLTNQGYSEIIGIRDVYPSFTRDQISKLQMSMRTGIKTSLAPVTIVLSTMEVEAWFLAEENHYPAISDLLTAERVAESLGFDPRVDDMTLRNHPAADLNAAYGLVGETYTKALAARTVERLDYLNLYCNVRSRIPELNLVSERIDHFLAA